MAMTDGTDALHPERRRIRLPLRRDASGYPPADAEMVYAEALGGGRYRLDNIPIFALGVSCGDVVSARIVDSVPTFAGIVEKGGHSTLRVVAMDDSTFLAACEQLRLLGCGLERTHLSRLVAVDVPPSVDVASVVAYLRTAAESGRLDWEEADLDYTSQSG